MRLTAFYVYMVGFNVSFKSMASSLNKRKIMMLQMVIGLSEAT